MALRRPTIRLDSVMPAWGWLRTYQRADLRGDLTAGLVIAVMLIPQTMAYALLAGLPPIYGLYTSILPMVVYALFGTSRHLSIGPPALMALLTFTGVSALAQPQTGQYITLALLLAVMVGVVQVLLGTLRLGFITNLIPRPVLSGFIFASVVVIIVSQLKYVFGLAVTGRGSVVKTLTQLGQKIGNTDPATVVIGVASVVVLVVVRKVAPRVPGPLLVVVCATLAVYLLGLDGQVAVVGHVPHGLPSLTLPPLKAKMLGDLAPAAAGIVLVGYIETFSIAKAIAAREKYRIDANQEFVALGLANVASGLFSGFSVAGSFSRTAVNYQSGARTQLSSMISTAFVIVALLFLTPLLHDIPIAALAAIIIVAVYRLFDVPEIRHIVRVSRADGLVLAVTFLITLFVGIVQGILLGAAFGLLMFLKRTVRPDVIELGYVPGADAFLGLRSHPAARTLPQVLILRFDSALFYANVALLQQLLINAAAERAELAHIIIDCRGTNSIDVTALDELADLIEELGDQRLTVALTHTKLPLRERFERAGWNDRFPASVAGHATTRAALAELGLLEALRGATPPAAATAPVDRAEPSDRGGLGDGDGATARTDPAVRGEPAADDDR